MEFGTVDFKSDSMEFNFTDYYFKAMGGPLFRLFVSFERLIDPGEIAGFKVLTNALEQRTAALSGEKRTLNIDPGYVSATAYILATSKNYAHRIYLGHGVFAQQELLFGKKKIQTLDWTYPDYRSIEYQEIFKKIRSAYLSQLKMQMNRNFPAGEVSKIIQESS